MLFYGTSQLMDESSIAYRIQYKERITKISSSLYPRASFWLP